MTITTINFNEGRTEEELDKDHYARTLRPEDLGFNEKSGWTIEGDVHEDWYEWVNYFEATHPVLGWVKGDYEDCLTGSSKKALKHFMENHPADEWDYFDI